MRLSSWLRVLFFSLAAQAAAGQNPAPSNTNDGQTRRAAAPSAPEDRCTIEGQVLNAATGEPLKKANLRLQRTDLTPDVTSMPVIYTTSTDPGGNFVMKDIEAGKYRLNVNRNGFVSTAYGARRAGGPGTTLTLNRGETMKNIVFRMTPHGVITGRILDEDGEPIARVGVQVLTYRYQQGRKQLSYAGGASTNDLGEYRIFGIPPGKYFVSAAWNEQEYGLMEDRSAVPRTDEGYVPTYYPGTTDVGTAARVDVAPGAQLQGLAFTLIRAQTVHIKGHVSYDLPGRHRVMIYVLPRGPNGGAPMTIRPAAVDAKGDFDIRGLGPGSYSLTAVINDGPKVYQGKLAVDVGNTNVERLTLMIGAGLEVAGKVVLEGPDNADLSNVRVMLRSREPGGIMAAGFAPRALDENRGFTIQDIWPGLFDVNVTGLPAGYYVKSIRSEQTDVLVNGLNTETAPAPITVLLSPNAAQVTGTVQNSQTGKAAPGATVVLIPQEKERKDIQANYKQVSSDQNGAFTFKDLRPGAYKAYAWEDIESGAFLDPEFVKPVETKGEALTIQEKDQTSVQLTLIPADVSGGVN